MTSLWQQSFDSHLFFVVVFVLFCFVFFKIALMFSLIERLISSQTLNYRLQALSYDKDMRYLSSHPGNLFDIMF